MFLVNNLPDWSDMSIKKVKLCLPARKPRANCLTGGCNSRILNQEG
jgi:hypothetical protein